MKFILPSIGDLEFSTLNYEYTCAYSDNKNMHDTESKKHMLSCNDILQENCTICTLSQKADKITQHSS